MPSRTAADAAVDKAALAADAWRPLIDFIVATGPRRSRLFAELGLTPNDGRALGSLDREIGRSMRSLAAEWGCDASTATWAIDRLVAKGLASRSSDARDRRVILVTLSDDGAATARELRARAHVPPQELLAMSEEDLVALRDAARKLPGGSDD